jgi:uncharacterized lipoprotein YbaY
MHREGAFSCAHLKGLIMIRPSALAFAASLLALSACGPDAGNQTDAPVEVRGALAFEADGLDADVFAVVELADASDPEAPQAGFARIEIAGRDSPVAFSFQADPAQIDPDASYAVTAAAFSGSEPVLLSDPVPVDVSRRPIEAGTVTLAPLIIEDGLDGGGQEGPADAVYQCGDIPVIVEFDGQGGATLYHAEDEFALRRTEEGGARYALEGDPSTFLEDRGGEAVIEVRGESLGQCLRFF